MKYYIKVFGLLVVAATAFTAFAASASAVTVTSPTGTVYTSTIHATTEGHAVLKNPIANIECHGTVQGKVENHGPGLSATGEITSLVWGTQGNLNGICTNNWHVTTVAKGSLILHWKAEHEGTLTSTGTKVDTTRLGVTCVYETNNTPIGTLTDSHKTGTTAAPSTATLDISASIPINTVESSGLCGSSAAEWKGSYEVLTPDKLYIDQN